MGEVIQFKGVSSTEEMRQRFEAFVRKGCRRQDEADTYLVRSRGGEYVMTATKAGWASWQGAIADLIELYKADTQPTRGE